MSEETEEDLQPATSEALNRSDKFIMWKNGQSLMRRRLVDEVAEVVPRLFLGSYFPTRDEDFLRSRGVTHVLSIGHPPSKTIQGIKYSFFSVPDDPDFEIKGIFRMCTMMIEEDRSAGGAVLVHCHYGVSRSPTVVIAYLMMTEKITFEVALARVKEVRVIAQPNKGFVSQLKLFEKELKDTWGSEELKDNFGQEEVKENNGQKVLTGDLKEEELKNNISQKELKNNLVEESNQNLNQEELKNNKSQEKRKDTEGVT